MAIERGLYIMGKKRYFWGVFLLLAGAYLVISRLGYVPAVGPFSILFTIACIAIIVASIPKLEFGGILFPLAIIGIIYDEPLHITSLTPWTILLVALLGTIGLSLIFSPLKKKLKKNHCSGNCRKDMSNVKGEEVNGEKIWLRSNFGGLLRYITSDNLNYVELQASFSGVKVYFDSAQVPSGNVTLEISSKFSGVEIYVPKNWKIVNQLDASFGSVDIKGAPNESTNVVMTIMGDMSFGGVEIHYV